MSALEVLALTTAGYAGGLEYLDSNSLVYGTGQGLVQHDFESGVQVRGSGPPACMPV